MISNLEQLAIRATVLMIWTDCDREGEYIGSEIRKICTSKNNTLTSVESKIFLTDRRELHNALINANRLNEHIVDAVAARIETDLRTGAAFTRFLTLFLRTGLCCIEDSRHFLWYIHFLMLQGSCQFPTLGFIVEQYWKVKNFRAEEFYYLKVITRSMVTFSIGKEFDFLIEQSLQHCSYTAKEKILR